MARTFGTGDEVNFGTNISKLSIAEYTILAWAFRTTGTMNDGRITNRASGTSAGHMQLTDNSQVLGGMRVGSLRLRQTFSTTAALARSVGANFILLDEWAFYVGTLDSSKVPRLFRSKPDESAMVEATYDPQTTGVGTLLDKENEEFLIGNSGFATSQNWIGRLGNVSIYDRELSQNEMLSVKAGMILEGQIFFAPIWGIATPEPDLSPNPELGTVAGATRADHAPVGFYGAVT